jgi:CRISPR/Cas system-associated exonuclease Cas4 (RecB family)
MKTSIGIERISPSMITEYESCPKLFYYRSFLGLKLPQPMVHLDFGTAIHEAIDRLYNGRNKEGLWSDDSAAHEALKVFSQKFTRPSCESDSQFKEMYEDGVQIIKEYWDEKEVLLAKGFNPIKFEIPGKDVMLNPETKEPLPIPLSYRLDAILANHGVGEFKTSSAYYDNFEARSRPQSLAYVWVYFQKYGVIPTLHYVVMIKKKKKDKLQHLSFKYEMADILLFDAKVRNIIDKITNREFDRPRVGHNRWCDCIKFEEALKI